MNDDDSPRWRTEREITYLVPGGVRTYRLRGADPVPEDAEGELLDVRNYRLPDNEAAAEHDAEQARLARFLEGPDVWGIRDALKVAYRKQRARVRGHKGGKAPKLLAGIQGATDRHLKARPKATTEELWRAFPDGHGVPDKWGGFKVYRDGEMLVQVCTRTKAELAITRRAFDAYAARARRKLRA